MNEQNLIEIAIILAATFVYNIINGIASIFIAKGFIKFGALFDAARNVLSVLILSYVALRVKDNYFLLIPLFVGYHSGMLLSGMIVDKLHLGEITITAFVNGDKSAAQLFAKDLNDKGIMNTAFTGAGSRSKTIALVIITNRKQQDATLKIIKAVAKQYDMQPKITISDTAALHTA